MNIIMNIILNLLSFLPLGIIGSILIFLAIINFI